MSSRKLRRNVFPPRDITDAVAAERQRVVELLRKQPSLRMRKAVDEKAGFAAAWSAMVEAFIKERLPHD